MEPNSNFWNNVAKHYPRFNELSMSKDVNHIIHWCQAHNVSFDNASILDIGAGTGNFAIPLAQKGAQVMAIDLSQGMLETLSEDATTYGVKEKITIQQSGWDTFDLKDSYDIVIASMSPAISDLEKVEKMLGASKGIGLYVGWGRFRKNNLADALVDAHKSAEAVSSPTLGIRALQFIEILKEKNIPYEYDFFETSWTDTYNFEEAKEYAYDHLKYKGIRPDDAIVESVLRSFLHDGKIHVTTEAEKGIVLWKIAS